MKVAAHIVLIIKMNQIFNIRNIAVNSVFFRVGGELMCDCSCPSRKLQRSYLVRIIQKDYKITFLYICYI